MPTFNKYMLDKLSQRQKDHALRSLKTYDHLVDFASNDYLGIAKHFNSGSSGSRLISGNSELVVELEKKFAKGGLLGKNGKKHVSIESTEKVEVVEENKNKRGAKERP